MELTNSALQTVATGNNVVFTDTVVHGSNCIIHRENSGLVTLRGVTRQCRARFKVYFGSNISIPSGGSVEAISLAVAISGEPVSSSQMIVTPAAVQEPFNISTQLFIDVPAGCCSTISVQNTSAENIAVQNANLIIERVA